ncbi:alkaline phosphatase family protein [Gymnodinialimonas sp. 57CJ19]|uniref:alkaline phosphatase family protein n=1 Tax=Gymnodinialimonas sp. 57CJ19 TaxID=3138498 RepID=UPI00313460E2
MAKRPPNILFIMCDQLRFDYLGCYGHPTQRTPNIDALAAQGVRFTNAYVQSPVCGPSRMSTYTGRYPRSHGSTWNSFPLRVGEMGIGDYLRPLGVRTALCGKSHVVPDGEGMERLGVDRTTAEAKLMEQAGFELWDRMDGVHPAKGRAPSHYNDHLRAKGMEGESPWESWANAPEGDKGEALSAWHMEHANRPAKCPEEDSETAYTTDRAMAFIDDAGDQPWCLHLSYIKPHWPYVASAPYHDMYSEADVIPAHRSEAERENAHPFLAAFHDTRVAKVFNQPGVRERVIPVYMGLITQIDDHIGRLRAHLEATEQADNTLIVFTSDHGDYLGDHWLGEKDLFHECSVKIPLIVMDPSRDSDASRGTVSDALVESIDLLPTFIEACGGEVPDHIIEGKSLKPLLAGDTTPLREFVISEFDYSTRIARKTLNMPIADCRTQMVFDGRYKLINITGFRPMLYDLHEDPDEFTDLGTHPDYAQTITRLQGHLFDWALRHHSRVTMSDAAIEADFGSEARVGIFIGVWDEADEAEIHAAGHSNY